VSWTTAPRAAGPWRASPPGWRRSPAVAGIPVLAAVSAPSSLAVTAAERFGMTLVGFLRGDGFNVNAGADRVAA
jgi:formate dehydrogenase accessory protein FdhD